MLFLLSVFFLEIRVFRCANDQVFKCKKTYKFKREFIKKHFEHEISGQQVKKLSTTCHKHLEPIQTVGIANSNIHLNLSILDHISTSNIKFTSNGSSITASGATEIISDPDSMEIDSTNDVQFASHIENDSDMKNLSTESLLASTIDIEKNILPFKHGSIISIQILNRLDDQQGICIEAQLNIDESVVEASNFNALKSNESMTQGISQNIAAICEIDQHRDDHVTSTTNSDQRSSQHMSKSNIDGCVDQKISSTQKNLENESLYEVTNIKNGLLAFLKEALPLDLNTVLAIYGKDINTKSHLKNTNSFLNFLISLYNIRKNNTKIYRNLVIIEMLDDHLKLKQAYKSISSKTKSEGVKFPLNTVYTLNSHIIEQSSPCTIIPKSVNNTIENIINTQQNNFKQLFTSFDRIDCTIIKEITHVKNDILHKLACKISPTERYKDYIYQNNLKFWINDIKHTKFTLSSSAKFFKNLKTFKIFCEMTIFKEFFNDKYLIKMTEIYTNYIYGGFKGHLLTFNSLYIFFELIMPQDFEIKDDKMKKMEQSFCKIITTHYKNVELIAPHLSLFNQYYSISQHKMNLKLETNQKFVFLCFLQLFEILLKLDWKAFFYSIKVSLHEVKIQMETKKSGKFLKDIKPGLNFYFASKIYINDISVFLIFPFIDANCFYKYVYMVQFQNINCLKTFKYSTFKGSRKGIKISIAPIFVISRFFFANELHLLCFNGDERAKNVKTAISFKSKCLIRSYRLLCIEAITDIDMFDINNSYAYSMNSTFNQFYETWKRVVILFLNCDLYFENMTHEWKTFKFNDMWNDWLQALKELGEQLKHNISYSLNISEKILNDIPGEYDNSGLSRKNRSKRNKMDIEAHNNTLTINQRNKKKYIEILKQKRRAHFKNILFLFLEKLHNNLEMF